MSNDSKQRGSRGIDHTDLDEAADYVLGVQSARQRADFERRLQADPQLQADVAFWQHHVGELADAAEPTEPSAALIKAIDAAIDGKPQPGSTTIRANDGDWRELLEGVFKKSLLLDEAAGEESYLLRLTPGARIPAHGHNKLEECLVMEGEMIIGEARFAAGDYHAIPTGVPHLPITSEVGALLYIRSELRA